MEKNNMTDIKTIFNSTETVLAIGKFNPTDNNLIIGFYPWLHIKYTNHISNSNTISISGCDMALESVGIHPHIYCENEEQATKIIHEKIKNFKIINTPFITNIIRDTGLYCKNSNIFLYEDKVIGFFIEEKKTIKASIYKEINETYVKTCIYRNIDIETDDNGNSFIANNNLLGNIYTVDMIENIIENSIYNSACYIKTKDGIKYISNNK